MRGRRGEEVIGEKGEGVERNGRKQRGGGGKWEGRGRGREGGSNSSQKRPADTLISSCSLATLQENQEEIRHSPSNTCHHTTALSAWLGRMAVT